MNYLKQGGHIFVILLTVMTVFLLSEKDVHAAKTGDSCSVSGYTGTCKLYVDGCGTGEKKVGDCPSTGTPFSCCVVTNDAVSTTDTECTSNGGKCQGSLPCPTGQTERGYCQSSIIGVTQHCCVNSNAPATPAASGTSPSGSASLNYTPLENLPGFENQGGDFATYFGNLYKLALWIVGISALFMLVVGGFLYLSSAGNTALLGTAKKTIYSALIGLVIALVSWLLLDTINSDLTNLKLSRLSGAISSGSSGGTGSTTITPPSGNADPEGCAKLKNLASDIDKQCNLASKELVAILSCMEGKGVTNKWTSISASNIGGDQNAAAACCGDSRSSSCIHSKSTCHYGCTFGTKGLSYAVDIGGLTSSSSDETLCAVAQAAKSCGGGNVWGPRTLSCGITYQDGHNDHLHVSVSGCTH